jgi:hypothetical protein
MSKAFGVLNRLFAIKAQRDGLTLGSLAMREKVDRRLLWLMRMAGDESEDEDEEPKNSKKKKKKK